MESSSFSCLHKGGFVEVEAKRVRAPCGALKRRLESLGHAKGLKIFFDAFGHVPEGPTECHTTDSVPWNADAMVIVNGGNMGMKVSLVLISCVVAF